MDQISKLSDRVIDLYNSKSTDARLMISLAGIPGSGKSTISSSLLDCINRKALELGLISSLEESIAIILPQDGFHYSREKLSQFPDQPVPFIRRGAPFTFDSKSLVDLIRNIAEYPKKTFYAPSFDHHLKDPVEKAYVIKARSRIIIVEGNYVQLKDEPWCQISEYVAEKWFVFVSPEDVKERLIKRHLESGISENREVAEARVDGNDTKNAIYIMKNSFEPDLIIDNSKQDTDFKIC